MKWGKIIFECSSRGLCIYIYIYPDFHNVSKTNYRRTMETAKNTNVVIERQSSKTDHRIALNAK